MGEIIIEEKKSKALQVAGMGLFMLVASIVVWFIGVNDGAFFFTLIGMIATIFFGVCFIVALFRVMKVKPLLTIKIDGIVDSSSASAIGFIPFREIKQFEIVNIFGQKVIGVFPKEEEAFICKMPLAKQKAARMSVKMSCPPVAIRVDTAQDMTIEDIYTLLKKRLEDYSALDF